MQLVSIVYVGHDYYKAWVDFADGEEPTRVVVHMDDPVLKKVLGGIRLLINEERARRERDLLPLSLPEPLPEPGPFPF
jgi:hypothetical protein